MSDGQYLDEMEEVIKDFCAETSEILEKLNEDLVELEKEAGNRELINAIFRGFHTLKGNSSFLGFSSITEVSHQAESVMNRLRDNSLNADGEIIDTLLECIDILKLLLVDINNKNYNHSIDITKIVKKLSDIISCHLLNGETIRGIETNGAENASVAAQKHKAKELDSNTIRINIHRLDNLMNLVGELVIGRNRLQRVKVDFEDRFESESMIDELNIVASQIEFVTNELQEAIMKVRMVPIKNVFSRLPRMVRDMARERNKEVILKISGEETELDRSVIEEIWNPLIHIMRNSLDHGIEFPEERKRKEKSEQGIISVSARHEGSHIVIEVADDGVGIDEVKVMNKALKTGLINETEEYSYQDIINFIFTPGFSTADRISEISGRGVGLDVVKTNVKKLNGMIEVESEKGKGTRFIMKIPLTLAIIQALLVKINGEIVAIPLVYVIETLRIFPECIETVRQKEVIRLRESILPLLWLNEVLNATRNKSGKCYVIVVGVAEERIGFVVDALLGQHEIVVKNIGDYLGIVEGISGATILGDGRVAMIIDVTSLISKYIHGINQKNITI